MSSGKKIKVKTKFYSKRVLKAVRQAKVGPLEKWGALVEREAKLSMKQGGRSTGPKGGKVMTPSTPPEPPNVQTGTLRNSITHAATDEGTVLVGPTRIAPYGAVHETGGEFETKAGKTVVFPQRAFMVPARDNTKGQAQKLFSMNLGQTPEGSNLSTMKFTKKGK